MALFDNILPWRTTTKVTYGNAPSIYEHLYNIRLNPSLIDYTTNDGKKIAAMIICSKILAQDIARMPIKVFYTDEQGNRLIKKDHPIYYVIHNQPNDYMDSYKFWSAIEFTRNYEGNAYAYIHRKAGKIVGLELLSNANTFGPVLENNQLYYKIIRNQDKDSVIVNGNDILHFQNISGDGLTGRVPIKDLDINLSIAYKSLTAVDKGYSNGYLGTTYLKTTIPDMVDPKKMQAKFDDFQTKYAGELNSNKTVVLPPFTDLGRFSLDLADAQFIETLKFNNGQVASYFGIPQHKLGNIEYSKYNNLQEMQSDYVSNTIGPIVMMYRRELERKLLTREEIESGYSIEFETGALLITDSKTRIENYKNLAGLGAITPNKIAQLENLPTYEGGDMHYILSQMMAVEAYLAKLKLGNPENK